MSNAPRRLPPPPAPPALPDTLRGPPAAPPPHEAQGSRRGRGGGGGRTPRTHQWLSRPQALEDICKAVANGSSLVALAGDLDVRFADIAAWLAMRPERAEAYRAASELRREWTVARLSDELQAMGTLDLREAYDEEGRLRHINGMPQGVARAIAKIKTRQDEDGGEVVEVTFHDKTRAIELLGKTLAMFQERVAVEGSVTVVTGVPEVEWVEAGAGPPGGPAPRKGAVPSGDEA